MDNIYIIIPVIIIFIIGVILLIVYVPKPRKTALDQANNACLNACNDKWEDCQQACTNINGDNGCQVACETLNLQCTNACYPDVYALRNGTVWTLYVFRSDGTFINSLIATSPYRLVVQASDFPIIATYCATLTGENQCDYRNPDFGMTIPTPGCYIVWYDQGYYTSDEICSKS